MLCFIILDEIRKATARYLPAPLLQAFDSAQSQCSNTVISQLSKQRKSTHKYILTLHRAKVGTICGSITGLEKIIMRFLLGK
jgi:hypothetical protein